MKTFIAEVSVEDVEKRRYPDKHYEYVIRVKWSDGRVNVIYRRYSRFYDLQCKLLDNFLKDAGVYDPKDRTLPFLPGKILFGRSQIRKVALNRLEHINTYCERLIGLPYHISKCKFVLDFFETCPEDLLPTNDKSWSDSIAITDGENISDPIQLETYDVVSDYEKDGRNEIALKVGWTVEVVEKNETGWWFVRTEEGQGWVPSSFLEKADGSTDDRSLPLLKKKRGSKFISTHSYMPQEKDEIQLDKGCYVEVLEKNLDGWWIVRCKGKEGRAPASYLARTDTLKIKRILKRSQKRGPEIVPNIGAVSTIPSLQEKYRESQSNTVSQVRPLMNPSDCKAQENSVTQPSVTKLQLIGNTPAQRNFVEPSRNNGANNNRVNRDNIDNKKPNVLNKQPMVMANKEHFQSPIPGSNDFKRQVAPLKNNNKSDNWQITKHASADMDSDSDDASYENVDEIFGKQKPSGSEEDSSDNTSLDSSFSYTSDSSQSQQMKLPPRKETLKRGTAPPSNYMATEYIYVVTHNFVNEHGDGINLTKDEQLTVLEKTDQGWWLVKCKEGEGWAPSGYIEKQEVSKPPIAQKVEQQKEKIKPPTRPLYPPLSGKKSSLTPELPKKEFPSNRNGKSSDHEMETHNHGKHFEGSFASELSNVLGKINDRRPTDAGVNKSSQETAVVDRSKELAVRPKWKTRNPTDESVQSVTKQNYNLYPNKQFVGLKKDIAGFNQGGNTVAKSILPGNKPAILPFKKPNFRQNTADNTVVVTKPQLPVKLKPALPPGQKPTISGQKPTISGQKPTIPPKKQEINTQDIATILQNENDSSHSVKDKRSMFE